MQKFSDFDFFCVVHAGALWMFFTCVCLWVPRASVWESMHDSLNIDEAITQVRPCVCLSRGVWLLIARICLIQVRSKLKVGICEMSEPYAPGLIKCNNWLFHTKRRKEGKENRTLLRHDRGVGMRDSS